MEMGVGRRGARREMEGVHARRRSLVAVGNSGAARAAAAPTDGRRQRCHLNAPDSGERRWCRQIFQVPSMEGSENLKPDQRVRLEGGIRPRRRRPIRAARPGVRLWTVWCPSAPATRHPFELLESGRGLLPLPPLPQAAPTSGGPEQWDGGACV
jgi:hypothetical protein